MSDQFEASRKNWLSREASERGVDRLTTASKDVFHRLRVAEQLILNQDTPTKIEDLEDRAEKLVKDENKSRQENIKVFKSVARKDSEKAWYEPYDMSPDVISDGVKWYVQLKAQTEGFQYMSIGISKLIKDLHETSVNKESAEKRLEETVMGGRFSTLVSDMVKDRTYSLKATGNGKRQVANNSVDVAIDKAGGKIEKAQNKLIEWVSELAPDMDKLYTATGTSR